MKLGLMQPYFFPYLGYFELIAKTDRWVVFDIVQYKKESWMNRNRILHPNGGWQYISLPIAKTSHLTPINQIRVKDPTSAHQHISRKLEHYRKRAPHFGQVMELVHKAFAGSTDRLLDINVAGLAAVCDYVQLDFNYSLCSDLNLDLENVAHAGQWALQIASQMNAAEYLNAPGGRALFDPDEFTARGIRLSFTGVPQFEYVCGSYEFVPNLSILDVLMWNPPERVHGYLRRNDSDAVTA